MKSKIRPTCQTIGCNTLAALIYNNDDGIPSWRKWCGNCHNKRTAKKYGFKRISEISAERQGFDSETDYRNKWHPYLKHRKHYCENNTLIYWDDLFLYLYQTTGRVIDMPDKLKGVCTTTIKMKAQLQVDHKDGNSDNNDISNLHTLCANCHIIKTLVCEDAKTDGRKTKKKAAKALLVA